MDMIVAMILLTSVNAVNMVLLLSINKYLKSLHREVKGQTELAVKMNRAQGR